MEYNVILKENLCDILNKIKLEILRDAHLGESLGDVDELSIILDKQSKILENYLYDFEKKKNIDDNYCWKFYKDLNIPYSVVYKSLQTLKTALIGKIVEKLEDKHKILDITDYVDMLLNSVAKVYIKKDIHVLKSANRSAFKGYLLFRAHEEWLSKLIVSIQDDNLESFPLTAAKECVFDKYLNYPESMMICLDVNLCDYLHELHFLVHKTANTFYVFYKKRDYIQAYIIFKELCEVIMKSNKTVTELYFLAYENTEGSFFSFLELLLYCRESNPYFTMIDFKQLKSLNTNFGELTMNKVLAQIEKELKSLVLEKEDRVLLVKGVSADYYMLHTKVNDKELNEFNEKVYKITNRSYKADAKEMQVKAVVATMPLKGFEGHTKSDFIKMIFHIKELSKKSDTHMLITSKVEIDELRDWLKKSYQDVEFITKKLNNNGVDVAFQPIYNLETGESEILEVLARLRNDNGDLISAGIFIDTIYSINKIEKLDVKVLQRVISYEKELKNIDKILFINISFLSLLNKEYLEELDRFIKIFGSKKVVFELTEQQLIKNIETIIEVNKRYGIQFAVDDFGSGYSSLKTVSELAKIGVLSVLKIDETLVKNLNKDSIDKKIVKVISNLADILDIKSVGEFIENKEVLKELKTAKVSYAQGFYLSKPKSIDEVLVEKLNGNLNITIENLW